MCIVFSMACSCARLRITLTAQWAVHVVAKTNTTNSSIAYTHHKRTGIKVKRRWEREREARQNESEIQQKKKAGGKNNLKEPSKRSL